MGRLATQLVTKGMTTRRYPEIEFSSAERFRERELLEIGKAFAKEMEERGNGYALKGGTALRFLLGVPRPSMDLDFEGEQRIWVRRHVKRALRAAFPHTGYSVSYDLMRTGEIEITPPDKHGSAGLKLGVDYRDSGFGDVPARIPLEKCTRYHGIVTYAPVELVHRELATMVGPNARQMPRDLYDTGWIATIHPELIRNDDATKLKSWLESRTPGQTEQLKKSLERPGNRTGRHKRAVGPPLGWPCREPPEAGGRVERVAWRGPRQCRPDALSRTLVRVVRCEACRDPRRSPIRWTVVRCACIARVRGR